MVVSARLVRSALNIGHHPRVINPDGLLAVLVVCDQPKYDDDVVRFRSVTSIVDRLAAVSGVTAVAATAGFPVVEGEPIRRFAIAGQAAPRPGDAPWVNEAAVFGDYARALGTPLLEGRMWEPGDRLSAWAVGVVNREAARRYWPSRSPIGEQITMLDAKGHRRADPDRRHH